MPAGDAQPHPATAWKCLLNSRSRVGTSIGRTGRAKSVPEATLGHASVSALAAAENNESGELAWTGEYRAALAPGPGSGQVVSTAWQRTR